MTAAELAPILADHVEWLADNTKGKRADLSGANLTGADLSGANLTGANLTRADLTWADLANATICPGWVLTKEEKP
jgi:uncharacterized protein YjbI with pentapeptide repeats